MNKTRTKWNKQEQLLALGLYFQLPFGQLHKGHPDIIKVAKFIGRTPSAVAMKACNFASLDPDLKRKGLGNISKSDKELWDEFMENSEEIAKKAEELYQKIIPNEEFPNSAANVIPDSQITEAKQFVKIRLVQSFFRKSVLVSYESKCAITGISDPRLLIASHIIPWKDNEQRRADPTNGIAFNSLHDRLFDQGLITFDEDFRIIISNSFRENLSLENQYKCFFNIEGKQLNLPERFKPDASAMIYHRENIFIN